MPRQQWEKVRRIFEAAKNRADVERNAFVRRACENDPLILKQVQQLLEIDEQEKDILYSSVLQYTTLPSDPSTLLPNQKIDSYKIIKKIGSGGMGDVYLADDAELNRRVALKLLPKEFTRDRARVRRFRQEARSASQLNHPNILTIHKIGQTNQLHYIVTEFVDGYTLRECLAKGMTIAEVVDVAAQIASALKTAHAANIVHRDIKPENVMVRGDRIVKVLDFGLAKLIEPSNEVDLSAETDFRTQPGFVIGTPLYMSPEQIEGEHINGRADLFALGSLLYECLTGKQPFHGVKTSDVVRQILHHNPPPPSALKPELPPELDFIVLKLLRKNPDERYQTAEELIADLRQINLKLKSGEQWETEPLQKDTAPLTNANTFSQFIFQPKSRIFLVLSVVLIASFIYFLIPSKTSSVKPEAQKLFESGAEAIRDGTYYKASKMLEDAVKIEPGFAQARARLAEAWTELDYVGRAQSELLKANSLAQPSSFFAFTASDDALYLNAIQATIVRDFPKAVAFYEQIAERRPRDHYVWLDLGRAFEKNEEADRAIECYEKAAALNPQYGAAFLRLGVLRGRKTEYAKADEAFARAEKIYDRQTNDEGVAEVKYQRGVSLNDQEKLDAARAEFEQVTNMPRANKYQQIRAMLQTASTFYGEGKIAPAREYAVSAINFAKEERMENLATGGLIDLGNVFLSAKDYTEAERHFRQALDFARTDNQPRNEARALLSLATLRIQQNEPAEARSFAEQALPFYEKGGYGKEVAQAQMILGQANDLREDYDGALRAFRAVTQSDASPANKAYAFMSMGYVLTLKENYPQALSSFESSFNLYQSLNNQYLTANALLYLSDALCQLGRFQEAKEKLAEAEVIAREADLEKQLRDDINVGNARIFLAEGNSVKAFETAKQMRASTGSSALFEAERIMCLAQSIQNSQSSDGAQHCLAALQRAENKKDRLKINTAKLALAEVYLRSGKNSEALKFAAEAKDYFISAGKPESGWRAMAIAALADGSKVYATQALEILTTLKNDWGEKFSQTYLAKPEVRFLLEKLKAFEF
jgi:serine/threonine protein kinase/lipopolysaccharide biosynthesis regulator YciM